MYQIRGVTRRHINRERILSRDGYLCGYCFERRATQVDHILPVTYLQINSEDNLIACCEDCNRIAGNKVFSCVQAKREYIQEVLRSKKWKERRAAQVIDELPLSRRSEKKAVVKKASRRLGVASLVRREAKRAEHNQRWKDKNVEAYKDQLCAMHAEGKSWHKIAQSEPAYKGISAPSLRRIAMGVEPGNKVRKLLGLPLASTVIIIGGGDIPPGAQVVRAELCECGQYFISNHPRRKRCFVCSPYKKGRR